LYWKDEKRDKVAKLLASTGHLEKAFGNTETGILGIKIENEIYFKQTVEHIPEEAIILRPEIAEQLKQRQFQQKVEKG